jgi:hypothetical protein
LYLGLVAGENQGGCFGPLVLPPKSVDLTPNRVADVLETAWLDSSRARLGAVADWRGAIRRAGAMAALMVAWMVGVWRMAAC